MSARPERPNIDGEQAEDIAYQLVTACLIVKEEAQPADQVQTKEEAETWLTRTGSLTGLVEACVDRIESDVDFGMDLIYELANLMATSMETTAAIRRHYAGKTIEHGLESQNLTGLSYWKNIAEMKARRREELE